LGNLKISLDSGILTKVLKLANFGALEEEETANGKIKLPEVNNYYVSRLGFTWWQI
jgi:hypothetical protein